MLCLKLLGKLTVFSCLLILLQITVLFQFSRMFGKLQKNFNLKRIPKKIQTEGLFVKNDVLFRSLIIFHKKRDYQKNQLKHSFKERTPTCQLSSVFKLTVHVTEYNEKSAKREKKEKKSLQEE